MNNFLNGWKGYLGLSIFLLAFAITLMFSSGLPVWFKATGVSLFLVTSGMAARQSRELYKKSKKP